jgi:hypothetical protein
MALLPGNLLKHITSHLPQSSTGFGESSSLLLNKTYLEDIRVLGWAY